MKHIEPKDLERYAYGIADPTERLIYDSHLHYCEQCQENVNRHAHKFNSKANSKASLASVGVSQDVFNCVMEEIDKLPAVPSISEKYISLFPEAILSDIPPEAQWEWTTMWPSKGKSAKIVQDNVTGHNLYCIYFEKGASTPKHNHNAPEETVILQGGYSYEKTHLAVGDYDKASAGTVHAPVIDKQEDCWCLVRVASRNPFQFKGASAWRQPLFRFAQWLER